MEFIILFIIGYVIVNCLGTIMKIAFYIFAGIVFLGLLHSCMANNCIIYIR